MADWRAIESAPTNESILIYVPDWDHYGPGIYRAILVDMGTGRRWTTTAWACGRDLGCGLQPTHWMPLPEVPQDKARRWTERNLVDIHQQFRIGRTDAHIAEIYGVDASEIAALRAEWAKGAERV